MRISGITAATSMMWLLTFSPTALAEQSTSDSAVVVELGVSRTEGKFALERKTTIDSLTAGARWLLPRGELRVSVPMVRLDGPGNVALAGGRSSVERVGIPIGVPPGIPGGGGPPGSGAPSPEDPATDTSAPSRENGLGDVVVAGEFWLLSGGGYTPWVSALLSVKTATGDEKRGLGTGGTDFETGLSFAQPLGPVDLLADAAYTWVNGSNGSESLRNTHRYGVGLSMPLGADLSAYLYFENRRNAVQGLEDQRALILGGAADLGVDRRWRVSASLSGGLTDTAEDFSFGLRLGYRY